MSANTFVGTDENFQKLVLESDIPVLVDFWAPWCGPCKAIAPILDSIAAEMSGKLKIVKMDVDENVMTPPIYNVRGIPCMVLIKNGDTQGQLVGSAPKGKILDFIAQNI